MLLAVSDTGVGMDEEVRAHLFEPFFTTKQGGEGTGLGLATVFGVVKQSGGGIYVYSERGSGTTFKIYLPAPGHGRAAQKPAAAARARAGGGTETVLVVEDDANVRELVRLLLESNGYTVLTVQGPDEAVRVCTELDVDLLLTDVVMPDVGGQELAERVGRRRPGHAHPVHVGLFRRGRAPPRRAGRERGLHREAVHRAGADREGARGPRPHLKGQTP